MYTQRFCITKSKITPYEPKSGALTARLHRCFMCEWRGSHMKRMFTCEPECDCVDWFVIIELGVVMCDQDVVV